MDELKFNLPENPQDSSPLFKLPLEIRIIILRHLVTQDAVITNTARADRNDAGFYIQMFWLRNHGRLPYKESSFPPVNPSSFRELRRPGAITDLQRVKLEIHLGILMTCQRLRQEGLSISYEENRLEILWSPIITAVPSSLKLYCCDILSGSKAYMASASDSPTDNDELNLSSKSSILDGSNIREAHHLHLYRYLELQVQQLHTLAPVISGFKKFHVQVELRDWSDDGLLVMCRALRGILEGRDVVIDFCFLSGAEIDMADQRWLECFRILRCKSFKVLRDPADAMGEVVRLITGGRPVGGALRM